MANEMIERVARKMCWHAHMLQPDVILHGPGIWREGELDAKVDAYWPKWAPVARDVIEAMMEPTYEQQHAAMNAARLTDPVALPACKELWASTVVWQAMLSAALNEQPRPVDEKEGI